MNLFLDRSPYRVYGVFGKFTDENGVGVCDTREHSYNGLPKLPPGVYTCKRRFSPEFQYDVFEILNVPGCTYIEIHIGNFDSDSKGCVLVGTLSPDGKMLLNSRIAFTKFMTLQAGVDQFTLTVR